MRLQLKFEKQRRENALEKRKKINGKANMKRGTVKKKKQRRDIY